MILRKVIPQVPKSAFDPHWDKCYCKKCHEGGKQVQFAGTPPRKHGVPVGWTRIGLKVDESFVEMNDVWKDWHAAFHGTNAAGMIQILKSGKRLLKAGDIVLGGRKLAIPEGHIQNTFKRTNLFTGKEEMFDPQQIFTSPSAQYVSHPVYAKPTRMAHPLKMGKVIDVHFMFQVRQRPNSYAIGQETVGATAKNIQIDPEFNNNELEWYTKENVGIIIHGLLVRVQKVVTAYQLVSRKYWADKERLLAKKAQAQQSVRKYSMQLAQAATEKEEAERAVREATRRLKTLHEARSKAQAVISRSREHLKEMQCRELVRSKAHVGPVFSVAFHKTRPLLATASKDGSVLVYDIHLCCRLKHLKDHTDYVLSVAFHAREPLFASGSRDNTVIVYDTHSWTQVKRLKDHTSCVTAVDFHVTKPLLATASTDKTVGVYDTHSWTRVKHLKHHKYSVNAVRFHATEPLLASASRDKTVMVYDTRSWKRVKRLKESNSVMSLSFHSSEPLMATGTWESTVSVYDIRSWKRLAQLKHHTAPVRSVAFHATKPLLATASHDKKVIVYDTLSQTQLHKLHQLRNQSMMLAVDFHAVEPFLATASNDGTLVVYNTHWFSSC